VKISKWFDGLDYYETINQFFQRPRCEKKVWLDFLKYPDLGDTVLLHCTNCNKAVKLGEITAIKLEIEINECK